MTLLKPSAWFVFVCCVLSVVVRASEDFVAEAESRSLSAAYALYTVPAFKVTFTSRLSDVDFDAITTGTEEQLLTSKLTTPLQSITSEFLMESFRIQLFQLNVRESRNSTSEELTELVNGLVTLELQVAVHVAEGVTLSNDPDDEQERGNLRRLENQDNVVQFWAECFTTVAFVEPLDVASKPSNQAVSQLVGGWIEEAFENDKHYYKQSWQRSPYGILKNVQSLIVETNIDGTFDPFPPPLDDIPYMATKSPVEAGNSNHATTSWSPAEKRVLLMLASVALLTLVAIILLVKHHARMRDKMERLHQDRVLSGRHDDELSNVLQASDRYLLQHRPDLFHALKKTPTTDDGNGGSGDRSIGVVPVPANASGRRSQERRYVFAANPLTYFYGASYMHRERESIEIHRNHEFFHTANEDTMSLVEIDDDAPNSSERSMELNLEESIYSSGYSPIKALINQVCSFWDRDTGNNPHDPTEYMEQDGIMMASEREISQSGPLACEEDPSMYAFPYQDFPRQDGTPCLIYNYKPNSTYSNHGDNSLSRPNEVISLTHDPLTDSEFQHALSQQAYDYTPDKHVEHDSSRLHHPEDETDEEENFTSKLERLIAMRHRHYEKEMIVEKHRANRRRERQEKQLSKQEVEAQMRSILLRRHSLELEIQELEASLSPHHPRNTSGATSYAPTHHTVNSGSDIMMLGGKEGLNSATSTPRGKQGRTIAKPAALNASHRRVSSETDAATPFSFSSVPIEGLSPEVLRDVSVNRKLGLSARKPRPNQNVFRPSPVKPPKHPSPNSVFDFPPVVSVSSMTSSMTKVSSTLTNQTTAPNCESDRGTRRAFSFGSFNKEGQRVGENENDGVESNIVGGLSEKPMRSTRHRRIGSNSSVEGVMVHGIYAQFV